MSKSKKMKQEFVSEKKSVMYIGPTIPGVVKQYTVFSNGLSDELNKKATKVPAIAKLIIPINELAEAKAKMTKKHSVLNIMYRKVLDHIEGGSN